MQSAFQLPADRAWAIPTSYGMVFSYIDSQGLLERVYLNEDAVKELLSDGRQGILDALSERGIGPDAVLRMLPRTESDLSLCRELCRRNAWDLFSLHPMQLSLQLLRHCNAECDFCYAGAVGRDGTAFMGMDTVRSLKDYAAENGVKLGMTGGEPLLHPEILDILKYRGQEVYDTLITNLTPNIDLVALARTGVDLIQVSIHGRGEVHDRILGLKNAYGKATDRMVALSAHTNIATNTVVTPANMGRIPDLVEDLARLQDRMERKLAYVRFAPVLPSGTGKGSYAKEETFFRRVRDMLSGIEREWGLKMEFELPLLHPNPYEYRLSDGKTTCPAGATVAVVRLDGSVSPCNQFVDTGISTEATVAECDFRDMWINDPLLGSMRRARVIPPSGDFCGGCDYLASMGCDRVGDNPS